MHQLKGLQNKYLPHEFIITHFAIRFLEAGFEWGARGTSSL